MAKNILVLSCDFRETRAALIEDGIIAELHIERKGRQSSTVGNVYLGKVTRVLPGLQAAFIDIGQERAAFLHVEDLIRPDDFDEYLAGGRKLARSNEETAVGESEDEAEAVVAEAEGAEAAAAATAGEAGEAASTTDATAPAEAAVISGPASASEGAPVSLPPQNDLETTVAYGSWPESQPGRPRNGAAKLDRALAAEADGAPSSEPVTSPRRARSSAPPRIVAPAAAPALRSQPEGSVAVPAASPSVHDLVPPAEGSGEELLVSGTSVDAFESGHSLHSAPTLDELPDDEDDDLDGDADLDDEEDDDDDEETEVSGLPDATPSG